MYNNIIHKKKRYCFFYSIINVNPIQYFKQKKKGLNTIIILTFW